MRERPIIFNNDMVRAILDGRKTQTRRIVKGVPSTHDFHGWVMNSSTPADEGKACWATGKSPLLNNIIRIRSPFGEIGGRLWVRETFYMPRWASRILLEITDVRVEKLKHVPRAGIIAEGYPSERAADGGEFDPFLWYRDLWESIYGEESWQANPWVWVIEFIPVVTHEQYSKTSVGFFSADQNYSARKNARSR